MKTDIRESCKLDKHYSSTAYYSYDFISLYFFFLFMSIKTKRQYTTAMLENFM